MGENRYLGYRIIGEFGGLMQVGLADQDFWLLTGPQIILFRNFTEVPAAI